eukprot:GHVU01222140.1.p1 GENE.GHVU01222140.1~~GHVU01222140.1.p1  ORF type:complete len:446 (+),score=65.88 GHVU01222140.1:89-1426(+)
MSDTVETTRWMTNGCITSTMMTVMMNAVPGKFGNPPPVVPLRASTVTYCRLLLLLVLNLKSTAAAVLNTDVVSSVVHCSGRARAFVGCHLEHHDVVSCREDTTHSCDPSCSAKRVTVSQIACRSRRTGDIVSDLRAKVHYFVPCDDAHCTPRGHAGASVDGSSGGGGECVYGEWLEWGPCSLQCGRSGFRWRQRLLVPPAPAYSSTTRNAAVASPGGGGGNAVGRSGVVGVGIGGVSRGAEAAAPGGGTKGATNHTNPSPGGGGASAKWEARGVRCLDFLEAEKCLLPPCRRRSYGDGPEATAGPSGVDWEAASAARLAKRDSLFDPHRHSAAGSADSPTAVLAFALQPAAPLAVHAVVNFKDHSDFLFLRFPSAPGAAADGTSASEEGSSVSSRSSSRSSSRGGATAGADGGEHGEQQPTTATTTTTDEEEDASRRSYVTILRE